MEYEKVIARNWSFNYAESGIHPDWAINNARDFVLIALDKGIEPWKVFPGTRQVMIETHESITPYQLSIFAESVKNSKLNKIVSKIWMAGDSIIYINYVGEVDDEKASKNP